MMFGGKNVEWGYRISGKETWIGTKAAAEAHIKRMRKNSKSGGTVPKLIQRKTKTRDGCSGGKCRGNYQCTKHSKGSVKGSDFELYDKNGRNKNTKRWDE